jgi:hypothetical protein
MREHSLSVIVENQADREWLKAKVVEEHLPDRAIVLEGHTKAWHPALRKLVKAYEEVFETPSGRKHSREDPHRTFDIAAWSLVDQGRVNARSAALARVSAVTWRPASDASPASTTLQIRPASVTAPMAIALAACKRRVQYGHRHHHAQLQRRCDHQQTSGLHANHRRRWRHGHRQRELHLQRQW